MTDPTAWWGLRGVDAAMGARFIDAGLRAGSSVDTVLDEPPVRRAATTRDGMDDDDEELAGPPPSAERLVAQAVALAGDDLDAARLVDRYWRFAPDEELVGRTPADLLGAATSHLSLVQQRLPGELKLRVRDHTGAADQVGVAAMPYTLIEIAADDMPFLVDSLTAALAARNLDAHLLVHPVVVVRRTPLGALTEVAADVEPDDAIAGDTVESWIRIEADRVRDPDEREQLERELRRVLVDVREAVEDWPRMRAAALSIADELAGAQPGGARPPVPDKDITDSVSLLRWLADDNFTFLGYREYDLVDDEVLRARLGTGLGVLRSDQAAPRRLSSMSPEARDRALERRLLIVTKANSRSTVHRNSYLDYIGLKTFDADGNVAGERRFIGLFTSSAYRDSVRDLPVVSRKVHEVMERSGLSERSHSGKDLLDILESYPRDELFSIATEDLYHAAIGVLRMAGRRQLRVFLRKDHYGRFMSCLIYLPRDRFNTRSRLRMQEILLRELNGVGVDYTARVTESLLARVHFIVRTDPTPAKASAESQPAGPPPTVDPDALAELLADATRLWDDDFRLVLEHKVGEEQAKALGRYATAFPDAYKDQHTPYEAVMDLAKLELLEEPGQLEMHLYRRREDPSDNRFKVFRYGEPMVLSAVLPVLHSLGVRVIDERPYEITRDGFSIYLYDFGLQLPEGTRDRVEVRGQVENAFSAAWRGEAEVDGFNELVLRAGLTWRQVVVLRAYAKYLRQVGTVFSQEYLQSTLCAYPSIAALLVALFNTRFDPQPATPGDRQARVKELVTAIEHQLDQVDNLDQDRIFRAYLTLIQATVRTSFFQRAHDARPKSYVAFKLDPRSVPDLPAPRPAHEIFVYSPRFEGVHLRFGPVARGGLRWSDRREDFRTEILGLVKAQAVKNAVIVPAGAKGGFVLKRPPPAPAGRPAEALACYRQFVSALLDVTDNLLQGRAQAPDAVVRYDQPDPYLVVAADKGTATFSDAANEVARDYGFWLDDAFASGGSAGYDHKKMGITARGAWESVVRHLRDLDVSQPVSVAGIGDMSGDVFGNAMLLSEQLRLVAAFDHRHIFLDPDPDPAVSYAERRRLFALPRSSWDDYDRSLISAGGGVYPRTAKSIPVTPALRKALGLAESMSGTAMPAEMIRAILRAPVDLLFNGGIGTYVKASTESHAEVGDKANDPVRINGDQLRCRVVAEGGNLGLTQRGRIEYALSGGRIHTDSIDNSAGVDCSDREVNIKILLAGAGLAGPERDALLAEMTGEVAALVLRDNYDQAWALRRARAQAAPLLPVHRRMLSELERAGRLDRRLEALPTDEELSARAEADQGLTVPELAVLMAYVKNALQEEIIASELPDDPWTADVLAGYFPAVLAERFPEAIAGHRLRREIVALVLVNEVVNRGGTSFVFRAVEETGASVADVLRAYTVTRDVFGLRDLWAEVEKLDGTMPVAAQTAVYLTTRRLQDRAVRWFLQSRRSPLDVTGTIAAFRPGVSQLLPRLGALYCGVERESLHRLAQSLMSAGAPPELADATSRTVFGFGLLDIVEVATAGGHSRTEAAEVYFALSERFRVDTLLSRISTLPREDRWQTLARMALRYDLYAALAALTAEVLASTSPNAGAAARVFEWERLNEASISRARNAIGEFDGSASNLAALSVMLRQIRTLVRTTATAVRSGHG